MVETLGYIIYSDINYKYPLREAQIIKVGVGTEEAVELDESVSEGEVLEETTSYKTSTIIYVSALTLQALEAFRPQGL